MTQSERLLSIEEQWKALSAVEKLHNLKMALDGPKNHYIRQYNPDISLYRALDDDFVRSPEFKEMVGVRASFKI